MAICAMFRSSVMSSAWVTSSGGTKTAIIEGG